jgi:hypothetical protein
MILKPMNGIGPVSLTSRIQVAIFVKSAIIIRNTKYKCRAGRPNRHSEKSYRTPGDDVARRFIYEDSLGLAKPQPKPALPQKLASDAGF